MKAYPGFVYILSNPVFKDDIFKIGHTTRSPSDRAWEIYQNATGVPAKFEVAYARQVANCEQAERRIHDFLKDVRINEHREFFRISLFQAKEVFEEVCIQVDLECDDRQNASEKTVIDRIGTRENPKSFINPNAPCSPSVAQEVTRIRRDNDLNRRSDLRRVEPDANEPERKRPLWVACFQLVLMLLGLFMFIKFITFPIALKMGNLLGSLFVASSPLIYLFVLGKVFSSKE